MALKCNWLARHPVTVEVAGSNPVWVVKRYKILIIKTIRKETIIMKTTTMITTIAHIDIVAPIVAVDAPHIDSLFIMETNRLIE